MNTAPIPAELATLKQWVCWRYEAAAKEGAKPNKVPYHPLPFKASHSKPQSWASFADVVRACEEQPDYFAGIGFVFSASGRHTGIDFDDCLDARGAFCSPWAEYWVRRLNSYTEVSPSGRGVKVWVRGHIPHAVKLQGKVELYDRQRFFTVTGQLLAGAPTTIRDAHADLEALYQEVRPDPSAVELAPAAIAVDDSAVRYARDHITQLLDRDGIPARLGRQTQTRQVLTDAMAGWPGRTPDYSLQRYIVTTGLVQHGYPDAEIVALLWHYAPILNGGGKSARNWEADIRRMLAKARARVPLMPTPIRYDVTTLRTVPMPQNAPKPPAKPSPSRARKDRPQRVTGAQGYLTWLRSHADGPSGSVMLSAAECAEQLGCSLRTIRRYEHELKQAGLIERRAYANRQQGCLFVKPADRRGDNIPESAAAAARDHVVTADREMPLPAAEISDREQMHEKHTFSFGPPVGETGQPERCVSPLLPPTHAPVVEHLRLASRAAPLVALVDRALDLVSATSVRKQRPLVAALVAAERPGTSGEAVDYAIRAARDLRRLRTRSDRDLAAERAKRMNAAQKAWAAVGVGRIADLVARHAAGDTPALGSDQRTRQAWALQYRVRAADLAWVERHGSLPSDATPAIAARASAGELEAIRPGVHRKVSPDAAVRRAEARRRRDQGCDLVEVEARSTLDQLGLGINVPRQRPQLQPAAPEYDALGMIARLHALKAARQSAVARS